MGETGRWIVFGQSYGGVIARKYLEVFPKSIGLAITHGSAKYNAIDVAENMELNTTKRVREYFKKYPDDHKILLGLKTVLTTKYSIASADYRVSGENLIHLLSVFFAIYPDEQIHALISKIKEGDAASSFIELVRPLSDQLLKAGVLNSALAFIDLTDGVTPREVTVRALANLRAKGTSPETSLVSKLMLDLNTEILSQEEKRAEEMMQSGAFISDPTHLDVVRANVAQNGFEFHVFGSLADTLAINSIKDEQVYMKNAKAVGILYHFSDGTHREWLMNKDLFTEVIQKYK